MAHTKTIYNVYRCVWYKRSIWELSTDLRVESLFLGFHLTSGPGRQDRLLTWKSSSVPFSPLVSHQSTANHKSNSRKICLFSSSTDTLTLWRTPEETVSVDSWRIATKTALGDDWVIPFRLKHRLVKLEAFLVRTGILANVGYVKKRKGYRMSRWWFQRF